MKFLFVIQGEGRGHFTQALVVREMLCRRGDQVVAVLVGKSRNRHLPAFFTDKIQTPVFTFRSPNFLPSAQNKRPGLVKSVLSNVREIPAFFQSMRMIRQTINETQPDVVINFYELLTGLTYLFMPPGIPQVCIGHQYMFLHKDFSFPREASRAELFWLRFFTRLTATGAVKKLALSFYPFPSDEKKQICVVPPLIRKEVRKCIPDQGNYILGYLLNSGYVTEVDEWHRRNPGACLHFFWDKKDAPVVYERSEGFTLHRIDDELFIKYMSGCSAYSTTAGFESVCEALYLKKPVLMVPVHIEQECNAYDAMKVGAGVVSETFDLDRLFQSLPHYCPKTDFRDWADQAEREIFSELHTSGVQTEGIIPVYELYRRLHRKWV